MAEIQKVLRVCVFMSLLVPPKNSLLFWAHELASCKISSSVVCTAVAASCSLARMLSAMRGIDMLVVRVL
eukprot:3872994-Pyramimonas_sp.AAC.1